MDGYEYKGTFIDELAEGMCNLRYPNGDHYTGYFKNGKRNGRGALVINQTFKRLEGYWKDDGLLR